MRVVKWLERWLWSRLERAGKKSVFNNPGLIREIHTIVQGQAEAEVHVFFLTDAALAETVDNEFREDFERNFRSNLTWGPPWPKKSLQLNLIFDSHENVMKQYEGSYFLRLR